MTRKRYSPQRDLICTYVKNSACHPTAETIYQQLKLTTPGLSRGTVYRNLNTLAENGMIGRVGMISGAECFDWDPNSHEHLYCRKCHKIINLDLPENELNNLIKSVPGVRAEGHCLTVTGLCPECAGKDA